MQMSIKQLSFKALPLRGALAAVVTATLLSVAALADIRPGGAAPDFTAVDSNGKQVSLAGFKGKTVVLEWTNHDCPYTAKHYTTSNMQDLQREATGKGVVWLSIISSAKGTQGYVSAKEANDLTTKRKAAPTAVLFDPEGKVGRMYGAKTTPHMFVINGEGRIVYMGAIDDQPSANAADIKKAKNYVRPAIAAAMGGAPIAQSSTRPYGCSVKYADPRS